MPKLKKILIVEDEPGIREALVRKLSQEGYNILEAKNGEEGLIIAKKEHPDLILLDIIMPKMDGMTMIGKLRADKWGRDAHVIILTNLNDAEKITEGIERGVFNFLVKSNWKIGDVIKKVKNELN